MLLSSRSRILSLTWLLVPTLLWSLFLHIPVLCIDPLLLPAIERRIPGKFVLLARLIWVTVFSMILLMAWNIFPRTYSFYLHDALPFTPGFVLGALGGATALLLWFLLQSNVLGKMGRWYAWAFSLGLIVFVMKLSAALGIVNAPAIRQHIKSPTLASARFLFTAFVAHPDREGTILEAPNDTFYSFIKKQTVLPRKIIFMLVESWGETDTTLNAMAIHIQNQGFQVEKHGLIPYRGGTLSGEFRELCSTYVQPSDGLMEEMEKLQCAPQYLVGKGYQTIGVHGYRSEFYARSTFWNRFGIKRQIFGDQLQNLPECPGPFPAACDENLIDRSIDMLSQSIAPGLLYILTVSSHEPVDPAAIKTRGKYFGDLKVDHSTQIVTRRAISALVAKLQERSTGECTLVYLAGDHQPPSAASRGDIFKPGKVPYMIFSQNCPASQK